MNLTPDERQAIEKMKAEGYATAGQAIDHLRDAA